MGNRAKPAHDAADAERVSNRLAQSKSFGHLEIGHRAGFETADLEANNDKVSAIERFSLIGMLGDQ